MNVVENVPETAPKQIAGLGAVLRREFERIFARRRYWLLLGVLPLVSFALTWGLFSHAYPRNLPITVVDLDHSALSRKVTAFINATPSMTVAFQSTDPAVAKDLVLRGRAYAVVLLPRGMEKDIKRGQGSVITGYYNAQELLPGSIIASSLNTVVATVSAGINLQARLRRGEPQAAARVNLEPVDLDRRILFNPQLNYLYFLAAALCPTFLQLFIVMGAVTAIGEELKEGSSGKWLAAAGGSIRSAVLGKLAAHLFCLVPLSMLMLLMLIYGFGLPLRGSPAQLVMATLLLVPAGQACGVIIVLVSPSLRMALSMASFYTGTAFAFVGLTFPYGGLPAVGKAWGNLLPLTHFLRFFQTQTLHGVKSAAWPYLLPLIAFCLLGLLLVPLLKPFLVDKHYWGWL